MWWLMLCHDAEEPGEAIALSAPTFQLFDDLKAEVDSEPVLWALHDEVAASDKGDTRKITDGHIIVSGRVYIPPSSPYLPTVLAATHGGPAHGCPRQKC
jgi:hypothetical protein